MLSDQRGHIHLLTAAFMALLIVMFWPYLVGERGINIIDWPTRNSIQNFADPRFIDINAQPGDTMALLNGSAQARYQLLKFEAELAKGAWDGLDHDTQEKILSETPINLQKSKQLFLKLMEDPTKINIHEFFSLAGNSNND